MSTRRYFVYSAVIVAVLATGFLMAFRHAESKSIINILNTHSQLVKALTQDPAEKTAPPRNFNAHKYINELIQMDRAFCPLKFEKAWLGYIQATERAANQNVLRTDEILAMIGVATKSPSHAPLTPMPPEARDEVEKAWQNVERVALEYDVRIIHQS
jgi:hypothetical protein